MTPHSMNAGPADTWSGVLWSGVIGAGISAAITAGVVVWTLMKQMQMSRDQLKAQAELSRLELVRQAELARAQMQHQELMWREQGLDDAGADAVAEANAFLMMTITGGGIPGPALASLFAALSVVSQRAKRNHPEFAEVVADLTAVVLRTGTEAVTQGWETDGPAVGALETALNTVIGAIEVWMQNPDVFRSGLLDASSLLEQYAQDDPENS
jgi:hypothetical protein